MTRHTLLLRRCTHLLCTAFLIPLLVTCNTPAPSAAGAPPLSASPTPVARPTLRINAGAEAEIKDAQGRTWSADTGFDEGTPNDRPDLEVTGTDTPALYRTERYSMNFYKFSLPAGNYTLKLHFSEDFEGITDPSMRIFTYAVKDGDAATGKTLKEVKDFSPWKAAGAQYKAYIDTVPVKVTSGQLTITFTPQVENPQINAIEIIPQ